jgi:rhodanese-related sulfurtransferase
MTAVARPLRGLVGRIPAALPPDMAAYLRGKLSVETDCSDVASDLRHGLIADPRGPSRVAGRAQRVVVIDARSPEKYAAGHVPGAVNLPTLTIDESSTAGFDPEALYVTYCSGPHCNGSTKSALRLAELGFAVKEMIGGYHFWREDGHPIETS